MKERFEGDKYCKENIGRITSEKERGKREKGREVKRCFLRDRMAGGVILAGKSCMIYLQIFLKRFCWMITLNKI